MKKGGVHNFFIQWYEVGVQHSASVTEGNILETVNFVIVNLEVINNWYLHWSRYNKYWHPFAQIDHISNIGSSTSTLHTVFISVMLTLQIRNLKSPHQRSNTCCLVVDCLQMHGSRFNFVFYNYWFDHFNTLPYPKHINTKLSRAFMHINPLLSCHWYHQYKSQNVSFKAPSKTTIMIFGQCHLFHRKTMKF